MRLELNRGWQNKPNTFNVAAHKRLRTMASGNTAAGAAANSSQDCSICLNSIAVCPLAQTCYRTPADLSSPANPYSSPPALTRGTLNASSPSSCRLSIPSSSAPTAAPEPTSRPTSKSPLKNGKCLTSRKRMTS
ncbi:hypothetical protein PWT90_11271 [Aphanocladium album]|nr:hypothetical protein PWT90_11271 [Aphanocladium album]